MKFSELNLHPDLQRGLDEAGYISCMPVQEQVLARAFDGQDLYVQSQTGTGKTAAFLVVIFQRLLTEDMLHGKKAIIMVPTRELAVQVEEEAKVIGKYLPFKTGSFFGGVGYAQQTALLRDNAQIMVGTPGRVLDLNQGGQMNLMDIAFLILDEADRMFDMGFYPDLRKLIKAVPPVDRRQTMLFSATLNAWVKNLAWEYTRNPFEIAIEPEAVTVEKIEQLLYHVSSPDKMKLLLGILKREEPESAIIFCNTKRYAEVVAKRLRMNGFECEFIMGDLPQHKRLKIIDDIKAGKIRFLVATDVAARGLDIEGLAMVVNYDLPNESENYVHRIGRTARAGKTGKAFTLATEQDVYELPAIERYLGDKIPSETATEALFAEDASEGARIQSSYYEDRGRGDDRSRGRGRDRDGRASSAGRGSRDGRASSPRGRGDRGGSQYPARERSGGLRDGEGRRARGGERDGRQRRHDADTAAQGASPSENISNLSLEERMAYYKQKYDKSPNPQSAEGGAGRRNRGGRDRRRGRGKRPDAANGAPQGRPAREKGSRADAGRGKPATGSGAAGSSGAKKGLFSKILGIFKKK
ncbi:MAG: DEAD/DEAH box helicase [Treponema sp.]|nr:DEAD/DEAH box helicase [Treponema sp.]